MEIKQNEGVDVHGFFPIKLENGINILELTDIGGITGTAQVSI